MKIILTMSALLLFGCSVSRLDKRSQDEMKTALEVPCHQDDCGKDAQ